VSVSVIATTRIPQVEELSGGCPKIPVGYLPAVEIASVHGPKPLAVGHLQYERPEDVLARLSAVMKATEDGPCR
jgi:hypothetical protein